MGATAPPRMLVPDTDAPEQDEGEAGQPGGAVAG
jgi:hypothetical protein